MPHFPKPFFRPKRGLWHVQVDGRQMNLGPDKDAAFTRYHELMRKTAVSTDAVVVLVDAFLEWLQTHRAARTYDWYKDHLQSFSDAIGPSLTVSELRTVS